MGMKIEVVCEVKRIVELTDEDVYCIKDRLKQMKDHNNEVSGSEKYKKLVLSAIGDAYLNDSEGFSSFFDKGKYTEVEAVAEKVNWSELEERSPEEIFGKDCF